MRVRQLERVIAGDVDLAAAQYASADTTLQAVETDMLTQARDVRGSPTSPTAAAKRRSSSFSMPSGRSTRRCRPGTKRGPSTRAVSFWSGRPSARTIP